MNAAESLRHFVPELVLIAGAILTLFSDLFFRNKRLIGLLSLAVVIVTGLLARAPEAPLSLFSGFFVLDGFTHFFRMTALLIVGISILLSLTYPRLSSLYQSEYYALFLFMAFGLTLMASATNLLMMFLSIEFVSIMSYLLVGFMKKDPASKEASIKYLLFGSLASAVMLYGMSLLFGAAGSLSFAVIGPAVAGEAFSLLALSSLILILAGIGFKISMAPFHMWAPDIYEGAPTPVTAFLTVGPKALGFAVLIRLLTSVFPSSSTHWTPLIAVLAMLTMTLGNVIAIAQSNIKRLLAYSSIAQAGYILMGIAAFSVTGLYGVLFYLIAYTVTNLGAFTVVLIATNHAGHDHLDGFTGLARRSPFLAASLTVFFLSLAGIPPLAGFVGKFMVFAGAIEGRLFTLAIIAALNSAIAAYYYFKVVRLMYLVEPLTEAAAPQPFSLRLSLGITLAATLLIGILPGFLLNLLQDIFATL